MFGDEGLGPGVGQTQQSGQTPFQYMNMARGRAKTAKIGGVTSPAAAAPTAVAPPAPLNGGQGQWPGGMTGKAHAPAGGLGAAVATAGPAPAAPPGLPAPSVTPGQAAAGAQTGMMAKAGGMWGAAKGAIGQGLKMAGKVAPYAAEAWGAGDPKGSVLAANGLPSDHPDSPSAMGRLASGAFNMADVVTRPFVHGIATAGNGIADMFGARHPFDTDKSNQGNIFGEALSGGIGEGINAVSRGLGYGDQFQGDLWPNMHKFEQAKQQTIAEGQARQAEATNAALAPHVGGDGPAVLRPDQPAGSPGGQSAPNPLPGSPRNPSQQQSIPGDNLAGQAGAPYDHVLSGLRFNAMNPYAQGSTGDPGLAMQHLNDYQNSISGRIKAGAEVQHAKAQIANASGIGQYQDPGNLSILGAMQGWTPEQQGRVAQAMGHAPPGGEANRGYFEAQNPGLATKPNGEPMSAEEVMEYMGQIQGNDSKSLMRQRLESRYPQSDYEATTHPGLLDQFSNWLGLSGGMHRAQKARDNYNKFYQGG